jgi:hypothetical protein
MVAVAGDAPGTGTPAGTGVGLWMVEREPERQAVAQPSNAMSRGTTALRAGARVTAES